MILIFTIAILCLLQPVFTDDDEVACSINVTSSSLIVVDEHYKLPLDGILELYEWERFFVRCPVGTYNSHLGKDGEQLSCEGNTTVRIDRTNIHVDFDELVCSNNLPIVVEKAVNQTVCDATTAEIDVGFEIRQKIVPVYKVCFDDRHLVPLTVTFLEDVQWVPPSNETHFFIDSGDLYGEIEVDELYRNQEEIFINLGLPGYINDSFRLVPVPLLSDNLYSYLLINEGVFDYVGVVPQWSSLTSVYLNVLTEQLENIVYTNLTFGTLGVATLPDKSGDVIELYLSNGKVPVPRWIITSVIINGIPTGFFGYNNPIFDEAELKDELDKICDAASPVKTDNMFVAVCIQK